MHHATSRHTPFKPLGAPSAYPMTLRALSSPKPQPLTRYMVDKARESLSVWIQHRARHVARIVGFSYEPVPEGNPETFAGVLAEFRECGLKRRAFRVWSGASDSTVYTSQEANYAFRFVHDVYHALDGHGFDSAGELAVATRHITEVIQAFGVGSLEARLMECDTAAQLAYFANTGDFVADQLSFAYARILSDM